MKREREIWIAPKILTYWEKKFETIFKPNNFDQQFGLI